MLLNMMKRRTFLLNALRSDFERVSPFAMIGIKLTRRPNNFITLMSNPDNLTTVLVQCRFHVKKTVLVQSQFHVKNNKE